VRSLEEPGVWESLSERAPAQAAKYTWDRSAVALLALARQVVGEHEPIASGASIGSDAVS
jgi:hypothetical protein